jgi:5'-deoxynucleotidase YfbR-like HD superfamily hydrolase
MADPNDTFPIYTGLTYLDFAFSAQYLDRFHMCRMLHTQSLAAHSHRIAVMARHLLVEWREMDDPFNPDLGLGLDAQRLELHMLRYALDHDLVETLTGDMPSHTKTPLMRVELKKVEAKVTEMVVDHEEFLYHSLSSVDEDDKDLRVAKILVKMADIAEGLVFSFYNQGLGHQAPDAKYSWINNNWTRMAREYVKDKLPSELFSEDFGAWYLSFVVDQKCRICPQHA